MDGKKLITNIINSFFDGLDPSAIVEQCPNGMLWEAIKSEDAQDLEILDIFAHLSRHDEFFLLPEPISAIQNGLDPEFIRVKTANLFLNDNNAFWDLIWKEPAYLVSCDFKWMIAMTTEDTRHNTQLCFIVYAKL